MGNSISFYSICLLFGTLVVGPVSAADTAQFPSVTVAKPVVRDVVDRDEFIGRFQAAEQVSIRSRVGGYLDTIDFKDGQIVKQGDKLFEIDKRPFVTALNQAQANLVVAQSALVYAQAQFDRVDGLVKTGSQSVSTLDDRRRELQSAEANVQGATASVDRAKLDLVYSEITAPLSGRIDRHLISAGNLVQADQTLLTTIVSLDPIDFYFDIDERRLLNYADTARKNGTSLQDGGGGLKVTASLGDRDQTKVTGSLDFAENSVDAQTGTLRVRARFANPDFMLQPGLFGRGEIEGSNSYSAMLLPDEAISSNQNERVVYVLGPDNTVVSKAIRPGPKLYGYRVIRSGLNVDDLVVVNGLARVGPGARVSPVSVQLPATDDAAPANSNEGSVNEEAAK